MIKQYKKRKISTGLVVIVLLFVALLSATTFISAYFAERDTTNTSATMDVSLLFDMLTAPPDPTADWGTDGNPYLINTPTHLHNLYILQNSKDIQVINQSTVFQVSTRDNLPVYVGGIAYNSLINIPSIGSEDFPFISTLRGATTENTSYFIELPGGEVSNTSVIGNIRVVAYEGQIDIGLFGNIGKLSTNGTVGKIQDLLLYNIQVTTNTIGDLGKVDRLNNPVHNDYFTSATPHETNHIGILAGHAENCEIYNVSVYYQKDEQNKKAIVDAFDVNIASTAKYTTAGGIIGYYKNLVVDGSERPVNSDGLIGGDGGMTVGFGMGIMYSQDIWTFMETNYFDGNANDNEYGIRDTFDENFYGTDNTAKEYFQIGVFTFAHSNEYRLSDRISKLWVSSDSKIWSVSTSSSYSSHIETISLDSSKYELTQVMYYGTDSTPTTASHIQSGSISIDGVGSWSDVHYVNAFNSHSSSPDYRYMIVIESGGQEYALVKYGDLAVAQQIDTDNFIIPNSELNYYTFQVKNKREANTNYPPYNDAAYRYYSNGRLVVSNNSKGGLFNPDNATRIPQYITYGVVDPPGESGYKNESDRPLRIYDTISFMATSVSNYIEGVYFIRNGTGTNTTFVLQRQGLSSTWSPLLSNYVRFDGTGFVNGGSQGNATPVKIYAVRTTDNPSNPSESPTPEEYTKTIYTPSNSIKEFDMSKQVLYYTGNASSSTDYGKYQYDIRTIESLEWADNNGDPITQVNAVMKMADPTSYYYLNNTFWGVLQGIPAPHEMPHPFNVITVPLASIGFTVQGHGIQNVTQKSKVYVIVATDPAQDVDQAITISYFNYNTTPDNPAPGELPTSISYTGTRQVVGTFLLPPVPGATPATTKNIWVTDGNDNYTAYTNLNTVLVAYEFEVDVVRYPRTYYLEASTGSANFVYLSAERTASGDSNPDHTNDALIGLTNGIDYVALSENTPDLIATVGHDEYIMSQIAPYFGLTANPENRKGEDPTKDALKVLTAQNFVYNIYRYYHTDDNMHHTNITVTVRAIPPQEGGENEITTIMRVMNFNFAEWSYLDLKRYRKVYSDSVHTIINNTVVDWAELNHLYQ